MGLRIFHERPSANPQPVSRNMIENMKDPVHSVQERALLRPALNVGLQYELESVLPTTNLIPSDLLT
jgi:hypothetical protein